MTSPALAPRTYLPGYIARYGIGVERGALLQRRKTHEYSMVERERVTPTAAIPQGWFSRAEFSPQSASEGT